MHPTDAPLRALPSRRITRRRLLAGAAAGGVAAVALAACGGESDDGGDQPARGGTLRIGTTSPFSGLDPHTEVGTGLAIVARIYGYALHVDSRDDGVLYDHAETIEQPDPTTYLISLRRDVHLQNVSPVDGRTVDANDLRRSIERFRDTPIAPTRTFHASILDRVEDVDATTLRVSLRRPYVYSLSYLGDISAGAIIPKELIESGASLYTTGAGSGPFRVDTASPPDRARLLRHDGYYRAPIPYVDATQWQVFSDAESLTSALLAGDVDLIDAVSPPAIEAVANQETVIATREPNLSWLAIGMRVDRPPFQDARVRQALDLAIDRDALIQQVAAGDARVTGPVNPHLADGFWALPEEEVRQASGSQQSVDERRSQARALLSAAGAEGITFALQVADVPALVELADLIRQQLLEIGVTARLEPLSILSWFTNSRRGAFQATLINHLPYETPDIPTRFFHTAGPDAAASPFGFSDPAIDELIERCWAIEDRTERRDVLHDAQRLMLAARPLIGLFANVGYSAAGTHVQNLRPGLPGSLAQYNYEQWLLDAAD